MKRPEDTIYNPLRLAIKDLAELAFEDAGTYEVYKIIAYTSLINDTTYKAVRYFLRDPAVVEVTTPLILEQIQSVVSKDPESYLFHLLEEFDYHDDFLELLEDDFFIITEEIEGQAVETEYEKTFQVTSLLTIINEQREVSYGGVEVWNYERDAEFETLYLAIEVDTDTGWTTIWEGRRILEGELRSYPLEA